MTSLTPFFRTPAGFDILQSLLPRALDEKKFAEPAYDVVKEADNQYKISVALPGYDDEDVDITAHNNQLSIMGKKEDKAEKISEDEILHRGILMRDFNLQFNLGTHIQIDGAEMDKGILTVHMSQEIPEQLKPRKIELKKKPSAKKS